MDLWLIAERRVRGLAQALEKVSLSSLWVAQIEMLSDDSSQVLERRWRKVHKFLGIVLSRVCLVSHV